MSYGSKRRSTRHEMTIGDKMEVIRLVDIRASQNDIARIYNCSQSQISRMASRRSDIIADYENCDDPQQKKCRYNTSSLYSKLGQDAPSPTVMDQSTSPRSPVDMESGHDTSSEQSQTADTTNSSWLEYWKNHTSKQSLKIEDMDPSRYSATRPSALGSRTKPKPSKDSRISNQLLDVIKCYDLCDIYCADELALHYNAMPSFDAADNEEEEDGDKANGDAHHDLKQITVLLTCNVTGSDKRDFIIVENSQQDSGSGAIKGCLRAKALNAWMTSDVYKEFLAALDFDMKRQRRYILLLVDNEPPHAFDAGKSLEHVRVVFLRSYCTPFFHGIFYGIRTHYRKQILLRLATQNQDVPTKAGKAKKQQKTFAPIKVDFEEAVEMLKKAWHRVAVQDIVQCFSKSGICAPHIHGLDSDGEESDLPDLPEGFITDEQFENFVNVDIDAQCAGDASLVSAECRILSDLRDQGFFDEPSADLNSSNNSEKDGQDPVAHANAATPVKQEIITVPLPTPSSAPAITSFAPSGNMNVRSAKTGTSLSAFDVQSALDTVRSYLEQNNMHLHNLHALQAQINSSHASN